MSSELERLAHIASDSRYAQGANGWTTAYCFEVFSRFLKGHSILEMGPAEGVMTEKLYGTGLNLTVVEGSASFVDRLKTLYPKANVQHSLFEDFRPQKTFDNIILGHVLEHVEKPIDLLIRVKSWLSPNGQILCAVPNARSLHRQAAVMMGILKFEEDLNEADCHHGHRRVYNPETFRSEFYQADLKVDYFGGYWLKPLANSQIEEHWTPEMVRAFMSLGERYPDIAGEMVVVASRAQSSLN